MKGTMMDMEWLPELVAWGAAEDNRRKAEMESVASELDLDLVQAACRDRRKAVGLSAADAFKCIRAAQVAEKQGWGPQMAWDFIST